MTGNHKTRVLLVYGGRSAEHDVARAGAVWAAGSFDLDRYDVLPVGITTDGHWRLSTVARDLLAGGPEGLPKRFEVEGTLVTMRPDPGSRGLVPLEPGLPEDLDLGFDVVFPLMHGPYGEDGTVQGLCELADVPYVGAGVLGSSLAMDKVLMKRAFAQAGLASVEWLAFRDGRDRAAFVAEVEAGIGYPCFVKPANLGSSVGVGRADDRPAFEAALDRALHFDEWVIVEEAVEAREIEIAMLGNEELEASFPGEVVPGEVYRSYADKYERQEARLVVPAPISDELAAEAQRLARVMYASVACEGMARCDFFLEERRIDGSPGRGYLANEINTIPGCSPTSMFPRLWDWSGKPRGAVVDRLVELAFERHARRTVRAGRQR
ncbi:MAG: D-alanine--D-alanine ligase family protein [Actinomycetes bacterium]